MYNDEPLSQVEESEDCNIDSYDIFDILDSINKTPTTNDDVEELKACDYRNNYIFDPYRVKQKDLDMVDKLVIVFSSLETYGDSFSDAMSDRISILKSFLLQGKVSRFLHALTEYVISEVSDNLYCCSESGVKQLIDKGYIEDKDELEYLSLTTVSLISPAEFYKIIQGELVHLEMFKNIDDKEFGILPIFYNGTCYEIDNESLKLSDAVQFISSKVITSKLSVLFGRTLENKIDNSLDFCHIVSKEFCSNYQQLFETKDEESFDNVPYEINTPKGILNLKTLKLRARNVNDYNLHCSYADYLPDYNEEPTEFTNTIWNILSFKQHQGSVFRTAQMNYQNELNTNRFNSFMSVYGYMLTGEVMDKILPIEVGDSNTGKSTRHKIMKKILGSYAGDCTISSLIRSNRSKNDIRPEFIKLRRKRLVISAEPSERDILDEKILKALSGGDPLSFRKPHSGNVISFSPTLRLLISSNYIPQIKPLDDKGFYNRLIMFETKGELTSKVMNPNYYQEMTKKEMADKIFTFLCYYANSYYKNDELFIDDSFRISKDQFYLRQKDPVSLFFKTCVMHNDFSITNHSGQKIMINDLYKAFKAFLFRVNVQVVISRKKFSARFQDIAECFGIEKNDHDQKHGTYYDQFNLNIYNNPQLF